MDRRQSRDLPPPPAAPQRAGRGKTFERGGPPQPILDLPEDHRHAPLNPLRWILRKRLVGGLGEAAVGADGRTVPHQEVQVVRHEVELGKAAPGRPTINDSVSILPSIPLERLQFSGGSDDLAEVVHELRHEHLYIRPHLSGPLVGHEHVAHDDEVPRERRPAPRNRDPEVRAVVADARNHHAEDGGHLLRAQLGNVRNAAGVRLGPDQALALVAHAVVPCPSLRVKPGDSLDAAMIADLVDDLFEPVLHEALLHLVETLYRQRPVDAAVVDAEVNAPKGVDDGVQAGLLERSRRGSVAVRTPMNMLVHDGLVLHHHGLGGLPKPRRSSCVLGAVLLRHVAIATRALNAMRSAACVVQRERVRLRRVVDDEVDDRENTIQHASNVRQERASRSRAFHLREQRLHAVVLGP
mmetsp:Transcript_4891/g.18084  ORF Transcript_4891/g.18084 Transcript_4891/m.18084 type:complete len:410 (+) Transcript_4891:708-1937(+)